MKNAKNVLICVDLSKECLKSLKKNKALLEFEKAKKIHLVHAFERKVFAGEFYVETFPSESQRKEVENSVEEVLNQLSQDIWGGTKKSRVSKKCIISPVPKDALVEYARKNKVDTIVLATFARSGFNNLFHSSFADYMVRHAPCNILILRPKS